MQEVVLKPSRIEIKMSGFGGQGIALMGHILGKSAQLYTDKNAVFTQSYGPESRGGASSSDVVIDSQIIDYPYTSAGLVDHFIVMSKEAYHKYISYLKKDGFLYYDKDLVDIDDKALSITDNIHSIPATALAEKLGTRIVANIVMLGFFAQITKDTVVPSDSLRKAIQDTVPAKFKELNDKAFLVGLNYSEKS